MDDKNNIVNMSKSLDKLFSAGYNTSKKIVSLNMAKVRKIPNLSMTDFCVISDFWELVKNNNNKTTQLYVEFLSGYNEKIDEKQ